MSQHRKPPKPPFYENAQPGQCRVCGEYILRTKGTINTRANWHPDCLKVYKVVHWPQETRRVVWQRDKGVCAKCGFKCNRKQWELDHIQPLIEAKGRIEFWEMPNLQSLCPDCHKAKTGGEATARAAARAAQKAQMGTTGSKPKKGRTKPRKPQN